jgi:small subunit ribosomal protein S21
LGLLHRAPSGTGPAFLAVLQFDPPLAFRSAAVRFWKDHHGGHRQRKESLMQVFVRDNDVNSALRVLKKKMQREGTFREMKRRRSYEKPSERRVREKAEAIRRYRKAMRKRMEREGY